MAAIGLARSLHHTFGSFSSAPAPLRGFGTYPPIFQKLKAVVTSPIVDRDATLAFHQPKQIPQEAFRNYTSRDLAEQIRLLRESDPITHTVPSLASQFNVQASEVAKLARLSPVQFQRYKSHLVRQNVLQNKNRESFKDWMVRNKDIEHATYEQRRAVAAVNKNKRLKADQRNRLGFERKKEGKFIQRAQNPYQIVHSKRPRQIKKSRARKISQMDEAFNVPIGF